MQYLLLIYDREADWQGRVPQQDEAYMAEFRSFTRSIIASGEFKGGDALQSADTATSVRIRDGQVLLTDGPFAETREQLGGYYLIEAKDMEEAIAIGARVPVSKVGSLEVRPIMQMDMKG